MLNLTRSAGRRAVAALMGVTALFGAVLVFGDSAGDAKPHQASKAATQKSLAPTRTMPRELAANFALLRAPGAHNLARRSVAVPARVQRDFAASGLIDDLGLNVALARGAVTPASPVPVWIVPGVKSLCIWIADPVDGAGISCDPTASVVRDGLLVTLVTPGKPELTIAGLVPDDVSRVQLNKRTQTIESPVTRDGAFGAISVPATSVSLERSSGEEDDIPLARP